jgi:hypothetical protein
VVASNIWKETVLALGLNLKISSMPDITSLWNEKKKNNKYNMIFAVVLRTIWITRNDQVFNRS